jgi:hypothetical protein
MINYVHCHLGEVPDYILDSFESIYEVEPESNIIYITDQDVEIDGVQIVQKKDIISEQTEKIFNMNLFQNEPDSLWRTSIFRFFLVRDCKKKLNLDTCYHFDSDVLLFQPSSTFKHLIDDDDGLSITYHTEDEVVFGFSNFGNIDKIDEICDILFDVVFDPKKQTEYSVGMPNEMQLLGGIYKRRPDLFKRLDVLPGNHDVVFDPSSYGQFFGGTNNGHPPGWYGDHHVVGKKIGEGVLKPVMVDKKPYVEYDGKRYPIINLHIHSKKTKPFVEHIMPDIDLNIERKYGGVEMLPFERLRLYTWVSEIIKPENSIDLGCGNGGATYYISKGMKACGSNGKVYSCDPGRGPSEEFLREQDNVDYRSIYSSDLVSDLIEKGIKLDYLFFDGPEDPNVAMEDIKALEDYIDVGCYFSMHDWETERRLFDNGLSTKAAKIRPYIETSPLWEEVEVLDGLTKKDSVGLCLYRFLGK